MKRKQNSRKATLLRFCFNFCLPGEGEPVEPEPGQIIVGLQAAAEPVPSREHSRGRGKGKLSNGHHIIFASKQRRRRPCRRALDLLLVLLSLPFVLMLLSFTRVPSPFKYLVAINIFFVFIPRHINLQIPLPC